MQDNTMNEGEPTKDGSLQTIPIYIVTLPAGLFSKQKHPNPHSEAVIDRLRTQALSLGASYLNCRVNGDSAIIETDGEIFAKNLYSAFRHNFMKIVSATVGDTGNALIPGKSNSTIIAEMLRDLCSLTVVHKEKEV